MNCDAVKVVIDSTCHPEDAVMAVIKLPYKVYDELYKASPTVKHKQWVKVRHDGWEYMGRPLPCALEFIFVRCSFEHHVGGETTTRVEFVDKMIPLEKVTLSHNISKVIVNIPVGINYKGPLDSVVCWTEPSTSVGLITLNTLIEYKSDTNTSIIIPDPSSRNGTLAKAYATLVEKLQHHNCRRVSICGATGSGKSWLAERAASYVNFRFSYYPAKDVYNFPLYEEDQQDHVIYVEDADEHCPSRESSPGKTKDLVLFWTQLEEILKNSPRRRLIVGFREIKSVDKYYMSDFLANIIHIGFPDYDERLYILTCLNKKDDHNVRISELTSGYMFDDLCRLLVYLKMNSDNNTSSLEDKIKAFSGSVQSRFKMDIDRSVSWESLGGLRQVRHQVCEIIEDPFRFKREFAKYNIRPPRGILMHGPPGCSKTSIAKAIANSMHLPFYSLDTAAIFSSFLGESERLARELFQAARLTAPSIIFLDEIEVIVGKRGGAQRDVLQERLLATFLTEMDGINTDQGGDDEKYVLVIGATNRADSIDPALLRPGRFDHIIHVGLPDLEDRIDILAKLTRLCGDDLRELAVACEGSSTADLACITRMSKSTGLSSYMAALQAHQKGRVKSMFSLS